jgi:hypothetical protein
MRRLHGPLTALILAALASPAWAAEISHVASSGDPGNPFDLDLGVRWDRTTERATITRENGGVEGDRVRYVRSRNAIVPRIAIGLYKDLELHAEMPYVLGDDREWRYGTYAGKPTGPGTDTISTNTRDAAGGPCGGTEPGVACPIFDLGSEGATVFHGGRAGDLKVGIAWGIFNDQKDDTKPFWVVGMDITAPTAGLYAPGKDRTLDTWESPYRVQAKPGPIGERIWKWDLYTVFSKRYGYVDPYVKAHAQLAFQSASTYSNCDAVNEATAGTLDAQQMNGSAVANCKTFGGEAGAKLPFVAGVTVGTEVIPFEDVAEGQRLAFDFRFFADLVSKQRFYNELTDLTGKLHMTEGYMEVGGLAGLYLRASRYVQLQAKASIATRTAHYLTGETLYGDGSSGVNPNFDYRYDAPGRRFRISEVAVFDLSFAGVLQF